ncbi:hypothetical protein LWI28_021870 [Acer negundo]|uniref:HTH CENPB-type domain-containing protein n=1 Tax=Acer negundo TaxID=4023 RepID=A0AAD5NR69_ACENE|nr:hypothetical protein LWI28_021870 [Acer negundo]
MSNPHITMTDGIRKELCQMKMDNPTFTQKYLAQWLLDKYKLKVSQGTISNTLRHSEELLSTHHIGGSSKRHKSVSYPLMEAALIEWANTYQTTSFEFSNGWLNRFKSRHGIKSFRRFGEIGTVDTRAVEEAIPNLFGILDQYEWKDIYNMDETGLFYRLQADNSLATKQLEGRKQNKERITVVICTNGDGSDKIPLLIIGKYLNPRFQGEIEGDIEDSGAMSELEQQIQSFHYSNPMDVNHLLNHPAEEEVLTLSIANPFVNESVTAATTILHRQQQRVRQQVADKQLSHKTAGILSIIFDFGGVLGGMLAGLISDRIEAHHQHGTKTQRKDGVENKTKSHGSEK